MKRCRIAIAVAIICSAATPAFPCSGVTIMSPESLVERALLIVHARAERQAVPPGVSKRRVELPGFVADIHSEGQIEFRVIRVLKGSVSPGDTVTLKGLLESSDDFNEKPVPYTFVRLGGRKGSCYASNYRQAGDYLLLLNPSPHQNEGPWTAHWAELSPTNEQLRSPEDPWLAWVARQLR